MIYAIGGVKMGMASPSEYPEIARYGFIYTIPKKNLQDIHPDEDSIGELVYKNINVSGPFYWLVEIANKVATDKQWQGLKEGGYAEFAAVGKKVLKKLTESQKLKLLNTGTHFFNLGNVKVSGCYILRKDKTEVLTGDLNKDSKYMVFITSAEELPAAKERLEAKFKKVST